MILYTLIEWITNVYIFLNKFFPELCMKTDCVYGGEFANIVDDRIRETEFTQFWIKFEYEYLSRKSIQESVKHWEEPTLIKLLPEEFS